MRPPRVLDLSSIRVEPKNPGNSVAYPTFLKQLYTWPVSVQTMQPSSRRRRSRTLWPERLLFAGRLGNRRCDGVKVCVAQFPIRDMQRIAAARACRRALVCRPRSEAHCDSGRISRLRAHPAAGISCACRGQTPKAPISARCGTLRMGFSPLSR